MEDESLQSTCCGSAEPVPPNGVGNFVALISTELPTLGIIPLDEWLETLRGSEGVWSWSLRLAGTPSGGPNREFWASFPISTGFGRSQSVLCWCNSLETLLSSRQLKSVIKSAVNQLPITPIMDKF